MTKPYRFLFRMAAFLAVVVVVVVVLSSGLLHAFNQNVGLNGLIVGVLLVGIALNFRRVAMLGREVKWVEDFRAGKDTVSANTPTLLAPLATMLGERRDRLNLTPQALRTMLDGIGSRLDEQHQIARYFTGLMIFLGLLGTFWGLSLTVGSIGEVVRNLSLSSGDDAQSAFAALKRGLDEPLVGMGTAFSTSLIGLAGSLVLGFLDIQAQQAQNTFYNDLEEWLSAQTRISSGGITIEGGDQSVPVYIQALLEHTADSLDNLQRVITKGEEGRLAANNNMRALVERLGALADSMKMEQALMLKLAENQMEMKPILAKLADGATGHGLDDATRTHVRNIDQALYRLVEESTTGRDAMLREIRGEFRLLTRTIAAIADEDAQQNLARQAGDR